MTLIILHFLFLPNIISTYFLVHFYRFGKGLKVTKKTAGGETNLKQVYNNVKFTKVFKLCFVIIAIRYF